MLNVVLNGQDPQSQNTFYGTVGTMAVVLLSQVPSSGGPGSPIRQLLQIHNPGNANQFAFTFDGSTPVINGNGFQVYPGNTYTYDVKVPPGALMIIGSASNTPYYVMTM